MTASPLPEKRRSPDKRKVVAMTNSELAARMLRLAYGDDVVFRAPETLEPPYQILALIASDSDSAREYGETLIQRWTEQKSKPLPVKEPRSFEPQDCPEAANHGNPFRYCPVEGCGWHEGMGAA